MNSVRGNGATYENPAAQFGNSHQILSASLKSKKTGAGLFDHSIKSLQRSDRTFQTRPFQKRCCSPQSIAELRNIRFPSKATHDPSQFLLEGNSLSSLFRLQVRILEFQYPALVGPYIGNVFFTVIRKMNVFLPILRELILPCSEPGRFIVPPRITNFSRSVSPMMDNYLSTFCDH
jgi:hypothetical protein